MMYNQKLVCVVKVDGKVLREDGDTVHIPFGSEYSIFLKNLNSVKCQVKIDIDGKSISGNSAFIIDAHREIEIERSIVSGNMDAGNHFKFIERTSKIEEFKGVGAEDGLIRIEYEFERAPILNVGGPLSNGFPYYPPGVRSFNRAGSALYSDTGNSMFTPAQTSIQCSAAGAGDAFVNCATAQSDIGITVPGSASTQKFQEVADIISDGIKHVMVLRLLGQVNEVKVSKPVTVKHKPTCTTCGKVNKATNRFCSECGTALELFV